MSYYPEQLSEEDYETAENNGISRENAYQRVNVYFWNKDDAITIPVKKRKVSDEWEKWRDVALANGISEELYRARVRRYKKSPEHAAARKKYKRVKMKWSEEEIEMAEKNGIADHGMNIPNGRLRLGWSRERAVGTPRMTKGRVKHKRQENGY